ncbi:MAG: hypothetical protein ACI906_002314 [Candidatus Latescibacterota bacterium]|jgi:hypothetical protein
MQHITVYREKNRYAGWPANYGIWSWQNEVVVGFTLGYYDGENGGFHTADRDRAFRPMLARSTDGGQTWNTEAFPGPTPQGRGLSADEHVNAPLKIDPALDGADGPQPCPGNINFAHPDFALLCARSGLGAGTRSFFYYSYDRCRSFRGPFSLPNYGQQGVEARTDYLVDDAQTCTLFLTATKANGAEGRTFCARSTDGGQHFEFLSFIGDEPEGFAIMPASLRLSPIHILVARRLRTVESGDKKSGDKKDWIDLYASDDDGRSWRCACERVAATGTGGNPPTLTQLDDGRLCLIYGYRDAPQGLRARLSDDKGRSWAAEIVLRNDGGCRDLGYPRTALLPGNTLLSAYYYNDVPDGERYIAATRWTP